MVKKTLYLFVLLLLTALYPKIISAQVYDHLLDDDFNLKLNGAVHYNWWMPGESYLLDYDTEGFQNFKLDAKLTFASPLLPEISYSWETNLGSNDQKQLLAAHNDKSELQKAYSKYKFVVGFGRTLERYGFDFDPRISNSFFDIDYEKETFLISVSPNSQRIKFEPYEGGGSRNFYEGDELTMATQFEEIRATFSTGSVAVLPMLFTALFGGDVTSITQLDGLRSRFGAYYSQFNKPYSPSQIITSGSTSGDYYTVYDAMFKSYGLVEEYAAVSDFVYFRMQNNLGISEILLRENLHLSDDSAPLFFHYRLATELGFSIPMFNDHALLNFGGTFDWSFMYGAQYNEDTEQFDQTSFLNGDMILKAYVSYIINF